MNDNGDIFNLFSSTGRSVADKLADAARTAKDRVVDGMVDSTGMDRDYAVDTLVGLKGLWSVGAGSKGYYDSSRLGKITDSWTKQLEDVRSGAGKHTFAGRSVAYSPELVDAAAGAYAKNAPAAASRRILGIRAGTTDHFFKSIPDATRVGYETLKATVLNPTNMFDSKHGQEMLGRLGRISERGARNKELVAAAKAGEKGIEGLREKLIDNAVFDNESLPKAFKDEMRMALHNLPESEYRLLQHGSVADRAKAIEKALAESNGKTGAKARDFMVKYMLGEHGSAAPSLASTLAGSEAGGAVGDSLRKSLARQAAIGKVMHGTNAVVGLGTLGYALKNLYNTYRDKMNTVGTMSKASSQRGDDNDTLLRVLEGTGGAASTAGGGALLKNTLDHIVYSRPANYDVGFTYGDMPGVGDGHKAPSNNIRAILERGIRDLPDGHWGKKIRFHNVGVHGPNSIDAAAAKNFNVLYNTGLGIAPAAFVPPGVSKEQFDAARKAFGLSDTIKNYVTDTPINGAWGAAVPPVTVRNPSGTLNSETLAYGPAAVRGAGSHAGFKGQLKNLAPDAIGTPFIHPDAVDNAYKYSTRDAKLSRLDELADKLMSDSDKYKQAQGQNIKDIVKHIRDGKKVVTISGSGRGDYVVNRLAHILDSADRAALAKGDLMVVPMLGRYSGLKNVTADMSHQLANHIQSADPRIRAFGRLDNNPYTLLQHISDMNFTTTGQMGISENAIAPNLQIIPKKWGDGPSPSGGSKSEKWVYDSWVDLLRKATGRKDLSMAELTGNTAPGAAQLDQWNAGSIETLPKDSPNVFKHMDSYDKANRRFGMENYLKRFGLSDKTISQIDQRFDTDPFVNLLKRENAGELSKLKGLAAEEARRNLDQLPKAQKALVDDLLATVSKNNALRKLNPLRAVGGVAGGGVMTGLGLAGMYDALFGKGQQLKSMLS